MLHCFNVLDFINLQVNVTKNPFDFEMDTLFEVGARINPKRSFLFVSKLIGKHIEVHPDTPKATGHLLGSMFLKNTEGKKFPFEQELISFLKGEEVNIKPILNQRHKLKEKTLFIGFAETATGLAHSVFSAFENAYFVTTTREEVSSIRSVFDFKEEHSHATDHRCYLEDSKWLDEAEHVVLIDDEMTTGNTSLNLIRSFHQHYPKKRYTILSILDWRTKEHEGNYQRAEEEMSTRIETISLLRGEYEVLEEQHLQQDQSEQDEGIGAFRMYVSPIVPRVTVQNDQNQFLSYPLYSGRFGLDSMNHEDVEAVAIETGKDLASLRKHEKTLVLGTGEFMYLPSRIASYMGDGVVYKSTTRSPIYPSKTENYPIQNRICYLNGDGIQHYLYNLEDNGIEEIFILHEKDVSSKALESIAYQLEKCGFSHIVFINV